LVDRHISSNNRPLWPQRLWDMTKHYHHTGPAGGGIGYGAPAAAVAAVANRKHGRLRRRSYSQGVLWTCAHSRLPVLYVMHNNRSYHQELMGLQRMANRRQRGVDRTHIGVNIEDPHIDYATMARGLGGASFGPINDSQGPRVGAQKSGPGGQRRRARPFRRGFAGTLMERTMQNGLLFAMLAACLACAATAHGQGAAAPGDAANGKSVYMAVRCYQCHGTVGQGSRPTGPHLAPDPMPYEAFAAQVRHPSDVMPPYTTVVLSDRERGDIYAYTLTIPPLIDPKAML
jgi:hypothetical protein